MKKNLWYISDKPIIGMAPMDGVTDFAFRHITKKYGKPNLMVTEFTSVEGICAGAEKIMRAFIFENKEKPILGQLFGSTPEAFYKASFLIAELGFDGIDINMGCPAKNIATKGAGASLIKTPALAKKIISSCKEAAKDRAEGKTIEESGLPENIIRYAKEHRPKKNPRILLPISVKTRTGYDRDTVEEWIKNLLEAEPDAITIHGRTFRQLYTGQANWESIAKGATLIHTAKKTALGNGDIETIDEAHKKIKQFGVDGVLIGRAALGNPWVFSGKESTPQKRLQVALEHSRYYEKILGEKHFAPMRKHLGWYCKGFPGAAETRKELMCANSADEVEKIILSYK